MLVESPDIPRCAELYSRLEVLEWAASEVLLVRPSSLQQALKICNASELASSMLNTLNSLSAAPCRWTDGNSQEHVHLIHV